MQKQWFCLILMAMLLSFGFNAGAQKVSNATNVTAQPGNNTTPAAVQATVQTNSAAYAPTTPAQPAPRQVTAQQLPEHATSEHATPDQPIMAALNIANTPAEQAMKDKVSRSVDHYQNAIANMESAGGAYGSGIEEGLMSLGLAQQYLGKHAKAIKIYKRAMHLNRINEGLYSTGQVPILERLISSHMALSQWDKVSDRYEYLYWLNNQNFGENDIRMLPTLSQLSRWHLQAYAMQFGDDQGQVLEHLVKAYNFLEKSVALMENQYGQNDQRLISDLNGLLLANYFFATFQNMPVHVRTHTVVSDIDMRRSSQLINQYIANSFRRGKENISRLIDIHSNDENATPWAVAKAKVKLADWMLMFNKRNSAMDLYSEVYNSLPEGEASLVERVKMFDHPVALPNLDMLENNTYSDVDGRQYDKKRDYVLASFDVTAQGKTTNIEILESKPADNVSVRSRVKKSLRLAKFRPRFVEGEPVFAEKVTLRILSPVR